MHIWQYIRDGTHLQIQYTGVFVASRQILQEDVLLTGGQGGRVSQVDPHLGVLILHIINYEIEL